MQNTQCELAILGPAKMTLHTVHLFVPTMHSGPNKLDRCERSAERLQVESIALVSLHSQQSRSLLVWAVLRGLGFCIP
jgi:hypothetical protein